MKSRKGYLGHWQNLGIYNMTEDEHIQRHLEIVQRVYERLVSEDKFDQLELPDDDSSTPSGSPQ